MTRPGLLVSVRSAAEAVAALAGGADLIDVKEPARGPLGRADDETIREIVRAVGRKRPVSAALGEWRDHRPGAVPPDLSFVKWGLAGLVAPGLNRSRTCGGKLRSPYSSPTPISNGPKPATVTIVEAACELGFPVFLIDTAVKDGSTLLDLMPVPVLADWCDRLKKAGVRVALAGSLDASAIRQLNGVQPDWFAVRGAACVGGRTGTVWADRVRTLGPSSRPKVDPFDGQSGRRLRERGVHQASRCRLLPRHAAR